MNAIFPMKYVNITQKWGSGTHTYGYPIDNAGKDRGIDNVYAPFDGIVRKKWANGNSVWLESLEPVLWANGRTDYAVFMCTHDNNISDLTVGQRIKQGQVFYQEGTAGQATGNHVHMECGKGKYSPNGWYQAANGQWVVDNPVKPTDLFVLTPDNVIINTLGLTFKELSMTEEDYKRVGTYAYRVGLHKEPPSRASAVAMGKKFSINGQFTMDSYALGMQYVQSNYQWKAQDEKIKEPIEYVEVTEKLYRKKV